MRKFVFGGSYASAVPLLLDTYLAAAAYSLRKLRTAYTGSAIRVRRSSDNTEQDIGFVGNDLDTASLLSFVGAGSGFITTWYDQQGSYNMFQTLLANQPRIVNAGILDTKVGSAAIKFDGSNDYLTRSTSLNELNSVPFSVWAVSSNEASNTIGPVFNNRLSSGLNDGNLMACDRRTDKVIFISDTGSASNIYNYILSDNTNSQRLISFLIDASSNGEAFLNGTSQEALTLTGVLSTGGVFDIGRQNLGSFYLNGYVHELIIFKSFESANRIAIESNINGHYAIY